MKINWKKAWYAYQRLSVNDRIKFIRALYSELADPANVDPHKKLIKDAWRKWCNIEMRLIVVKA